MKSYKCVVSVVVIGMMMLFGVAAHAETEINVFFYKDTIVDGMNRMAEAFMAENPGVVIKNEMLSTEYNTVLKTKDAAGKLPEMYACTPGETALKPYIDAGKIAEVGHFKVLQNLSEDFKQSITFSDGKIYVIPFLTTARGVLYNQALFEQAGIAEFPKTLDAMKEACDKLQAEGIIPFAIGAKDGWTLGSLVFQTGHEIFNDMEWLKARKEGKASFKDNTMPIFEFIDLFLANGQEKFMDTDYMGSIELYATEQAAMLIQGPWAIDSIVGLDETVAENTHMAAIPFTNDAARNKLYFDYDLYFAISANADLEVVDNYLDFMINGNGREIFSSDIRALNPYGIPFETHTVNNDILAAVEAGNIIGDSQYVNTPEGFWQVFAVGMQEYAAGKISQTEMLEKFDADWDAMK